MSDIHAGPDTHHDGDGLCTWVENSFGQHLRCDANVIPLGELCADHEIDKAARRHFAATQISLATEPTP